MQGTDDDVKADPNNEKPACPIATEEHKHSANHRENSDEADPKQSRFKRMEQVVPKRDDPDCDEYPTDHRDGAWTFAHSLRVRC